MGAGQPELVHKVWTTGDVRGNTVGMARTHKDVVSAKALGKVISAAHKKAGSPSADLISLEVYALSGEKIGREQIRKILNGDVDPNIVDLNDLLALATYLRIPLHKLPAVAVARLERTRDLLASASPCTHACPGQLTLDDLLTAA